LETELQSAYMGTNLYQFSLVWNLANNSKSVENQKKLQLKKLFQITPPFSTKFLGIFLTLSYFPVDNSISLLKFNLENEFSAAHLSVALRLMLGPLVR
jgi:hypothetical protein